MTDDEIRKVLDSRDLLSRLYPDQPLQSWYLFSFETNEDALEVATAASLHGLPTVMWTTSGAFLVGFYCSDADWQNVDTEADASQNAFESGVGIDRIFECGSKPTIYIFLRAWNFNAKLPVRAYGNQTTKETA